MADNRKYYYLKLKENYFDEDAIVLLESMQDGVLYSNILLKLYLKSLKNGGKLQLDENIPYTAQMIATIGQSSTEGERKRRARRALQEQAALPEAVADKCPPYAADICPPERELEIEKEKEIEIELEIKREGEIKPGQTTRAPFGRYKNVFLSEKELAELQTELPSKWEYYIDRLSGYIASSGKKYKNHAATIRRWAADDEAKKAPKQKIPDYSYREGESL